MESIPASCFGSLGFIFGPAVTAILRFSVSPVKPQLTLTIASNHLMLCNHVRRASFNKPSINTGIFYGEAHFGIIDPLRNQSPSIRILVAAGIAQ
jgi:hypothetical protein